MAKNKSKMNRKIIGPIIVGIVIGFLLGFFGLAYTYKVFAATLPDTAIVTPETPVRIVPDSGGEQSSNGQTYSGGSGSYFAWGRPVVVEDPQVVLMKQLIVLLKKFVALYQGR